MRPFNTVVGNLRNGDDLLTLAFAIDDEGRPHSIDWASGSERPLADAPAALAGSRFEAGMPAEDCRISYRASTATVEQAPFAELVSLSISPDGRRPPREVWDRVYGSTECAKAPRPQQLVAVMPDFAKIPSKPGARAWTLIGFDIDEDGETQAIKVIASTGNETLDDAGVTAISESRFAGGTPKSGCLYPYWRIPVRLPAPEKPQSNRSCKGLPGWDRPPVLGFPQAFERRLIEGWALVRYDVASWGETGNVEVIDAQPASAFGTAAKMMIRRAKYKADGKGATDCTTLVSYVVPDERGLLDQSGDIQPD
ncbi:energy transducer TonB [Qipengyuania flava]|nr:energy transducer TonB [Qipengyuania flava]